MISFNHYWHECNDKKYYILATLKRHCNVLFLTSGARLWICSISAGTLKMCIRNTVINFSEKPADTRGRRARVNIAEIDTCFNVIFALPSPRRRRDCNTQNKNYSAVLHIHMVLLRWQKTGKNCCIRRIYEGVSILKPRNSDGQENLWT